jgi:hypothetical protein
MEAGAILTGIACAGTFGLGCAAAVVAELAAIDNFSDNCGDCNQRYYVAPSCPTPPELPPNEELMILAWNAWSQEGLWELPPINSNPINFYYNATVLLNNQFGSWPTFIEQ